MDATDRTRHVARMLTAALRGTGGVPCDGGDGDVEGGMTYLGLTDRDLEALEPYGLCRYLLARGWRHVPGAVEACAVYRRGDTDEVIVPLDRERRGWWYRRMAEAVSDLADYEGRPVRDVLRDLEAM